MKNTKKHKMKGFTLVELLVVIAIIAVLAGIGTPLILRAQKQGALTEAGNNAKNIASALNLFRNDKGSYPDISTEESLIEDGIDNLPDTKDANAYLAQLIVTGFLDTETTFFAKGVKGVTDKGDDIMRPGELLKRGENAFAYIMAEDDYALGGDKSIMPLVIAPLKRVGENPTFDPSPYGDKYVYGAVDGTSKQGEIGEKGEAKSKGRKSLFELGRDSLFGSDTPVVKAPTGF
jgi:prepilin-type N-terminal cleavage/methylation domain-containing protein